MRRRHREIAGGEVAMMAVITKAMGAFLVLMILLLPYYTGDTQSQKTVEETKQRIDEAKAGLDGAVDRLKKGRLTDREIDDLLKSLTLARDELAEAQNLIEQLRIKVDQAASQINRLEQQNAVLQAEITRLTGEVEKLNATIASLNAEIARLRAFDPATLQARIKELEMQLEAISSENAALKDSISAFTAKVVALESSNAALTGQNQTLQSENDKLTDENEVLRTLAAFPTFYLSSQCNREDMIVDIVENPINLANFKPIDQFLPGVMPWANPNVDWNATHINAGDSTGNSTTNVTLSFEEGKEYEYDFLVRLITFRRQDKSFNVDSKISDAFYEQIESTSPKNAEGSITSKASHPFCDVTASINWQGNYQVLGVFRLGPVEPVIHLKRMLFTKDNKIVFPNEDRPNIEQRIAEATCGRYPAFCALAKQHANLRAQGENPWEYSNLESVERRLDKPTYEPPQSVVKPEPQAKKPQPQPQSQSPQPGPPPPPNADKTVSPPP